MNDEVRAVADAIIVKCEDEDDLQTQIIYYASVVAYLVCHMARQLSADGTPMEKAIRDLYRAWADIAVDEFRSPQPPSSVAH